MGAVTSVYIHCEAMRKSLNFRCKGYSRSCRPMSNSATPYNAYMQCICWNLLSDKKLLCFR